MPKTVMVVAGEASGDQHAGDVVRALLKIRPDTRVFGFGGEQLKQAGMTLELDLVSHAVIGIAEALAKLWDFFKILKFAGQLLQERKPDLLVVTDFPDLNFRIAARAKALGIPVVYYISPQIWAWRRGRIKTLKRIVDHMLVVFPFEEPLYQAARIPVTFVGHPLLDLVKPEQAPETTRRGLLAGASGPLVALLPGSRAQEIEFLLPTMLAAGQRLQAVLPGIRFFIPLAATVREERVLELVKQSGLPVQLVKHNRFSARSAADITIVSSGTATLETAILGVPMLIVYRMKSLSYWLAKWFVKLPYFGLANLAAGEKAAPEFLQAGFTPEAVADAGLALLQDPAARARQMEAWKRVRQRLGQGNAAQRAAEIIAGLLGK